MLILGALILGLLAVAGFVMYLAVMAAVWIAIASYLFWAYALNYIFGEPYVAVLGAVPATVLTWWAIAHFGEVSDAKARAKDQSDRS